jgi:hypothetical protein
VVLAKPDVTPAQLADQLRYERSRLDDTVVRYTHGVRHVLQWRSAPESKTADVRDCAAPSAFKDGGVYLVTGGLGRLGTLFIKEIVRRAGAPKIIVTGRSRGSGARHHVLEELSRQAMMRGGSPIEYRLVLLLTIDARRGRSTRCRYPERAQTAQRHHSQCRNDRGQPDRQQGIRRFSQVLAPKVIRTLNLERSQQRRGFGFPCSVFFGHERLRQFRPSGLRRRDGFLDQFALYRNRLVEEEAAGRATVAINWPLWQDGGMAMDAARLEVLRRTTGIRPMTDCDGAAHLSRKPGAQMRSSDGHGGRPQRDPPDGCARKHPSGARSTTLARGGRSAPQGRDAEESEGAVRGGDETSRREDRRP